MTDASGIGILGMGSYIPDTIRTNQWWPEEVVARWVEEIRTASEEGAVNEELSGRTIDPFMGVESRHVIADDMSSLDIEQRAAERCLLASGVPRDRVDMVLSFSTVPEYIHVSNAYGLHERLELGERCFVLGTEGMCNSFQQQLTLAHHMIRGGAAKYALLVQSSAMSRVMMVDWRPSVVFGDGATAVLVGPVESGFGYIDSVHQVEHDAFGGVVTGVPGARWYEGGQVFSYIEDPDKARRMLSSATTYAKTVLGALAERTEIPAAKVDFYASHQAAEWFREKTQASAELVNARSFDTFRETASLSGSNIPYVMQRAVESNVLQHGDLVAMFSGAAGTVYSATYYRWHGSSSG